MLSYFRTTLTHRLSHSWSRETSISTSREIDADVTDQVKEEVGEEEKEAFGKRAEEIASIVKKAMNNENLQVKVEKIKDENIASMMTLSEESRRMQEMMKMYGMGGMDASMFGSDTTLVLNINHPLVQYIENNKDSENINIICQQLYDLASLAHGALSPERMTKLSAAAMKL